MARTRVNRRPVLGVPVAITEQEFRFAAYAGYLRRAQCLLDGRKENHGADPAVGMELNMLGSVAEYVASKLLNLYWPGAGDLLYDYDIGGEFAVQVRSSFEDPSDLCLHKNDRDDKPFVLVNGSKLNYRLVGWMYGGDGKRERWWASHIKRPCYYVPPDILRPIRELKLILARARLAKLEEEELSEF